MILLVGSGPMAEAYSRVLTGLACDYAVVGRGAVSAEKFTSETGVSVIQGGVERFIESHGVSSVTHAIVSVGVEALAQTSKALIEAGVKKLLVEKPAGLDCTEISSLLDVSCRQNADVYVAYNRRFFESVLMAKRLIDEDGGVQSFDFEVSELGFRIASIEKKPGVKDFWFLGNTSHIADLAFYLGGKPVEIRAFQSGALEWHPAGKVFSGAGVSGSGALFSYIGNWEGPGNWRLSLTTAKRRFYFNPLETLKVQELGSFSVAEVAMEGVADKNYKPGLLRMVEAFLSGREHDGLCSLEEQQDMVAIYSQMAGYE